MLLSSRKVSGSTTSYSFPPHLISFSSSSSSISFSSSISSSSSFFSFIYFSLSFFYFPLSVFSSPSFYLFPISLNFPLLPNPFLLLFLHKYIFLHYVPPLKTLATISFTNSLHFSPYKICLQLPSLFSPQSFPSSSSSSSPPLSWELGCVKNKTSGSSQV